MANQMMVIFPYRHEGTWVFDDAATGLVREPFVMGIPEMIDRLVTPIAGASDGFRLLFSGQAFPGFQAELALVREEMGGNWYRWEAAGIEGWLCPALFRYFASAPERIYARAEAK